MPPPTNANDSDSEDDTDYVPPADDRDSDSEDENEDVDKAQAEAPKEESDPNAQKKQRDALWSSFQASLSTQTPQTRSESTPKLVKIEKKYLFAGKHVTEVVEVPEDSEDTKKWPLWLPESELGLVSVQPSGEAEGNGTSTSAPTPVATPSSSTAPLKKPGPRKPRTTLPSVPKASQAKKITTLDKSAMDWRAHLSSQSNDIKDELNANRRGGGYLEKVEFLKRVEDRRDDAFEANKASKRRKI